MYISVITARQLQVRQLREQRHVTRVRIAYNQPSGQSCIVELRIAASRLNPYR